MVKLGPLARVALRWFALPLLAILLQTDGVSAQEIIVFDQWILSRSAKTTEAFTQSGNDTSLGVYCAGDQCLFYLRMPLACVPESKSTALINNGNTTKAFIMECLPVRQAFFQVLKPFDEVLATTLAGDQVGVAVPIQSSGFAVSRFETRGARQAIERAIQEATDKRRRGNMITPQPSQAIPQGNSI